MAVAFVMVDDPKLRDRLIEGKTLLVLQTQKLLRVRGVKDVRVVCTTDSDVPEAATLLEQWKNADYTAVARKLAGMVRDEVVVLAVSYALLPERMLQKLLLQSRNCFLTVASFTADAWAYASAPSRLFAGAVSCTYPVPPVETQRTWVDVQMHEAVSLRSKRMLGMFEMASMSGYGECD